MTSATMPARPSASASPRNGILNLNRFVPDMGERLRDAVGLRIPRAIPNREANAPSIMPFKIWGAKVQMSILHVHRAVIEALCDMIVTLAWTEIPVRMLSSMQPLELLQPRGLVVRPGGGGLEAPSVRPLSSRTPSSQERLPFECVKFDAIRPLLRGSGWSRPDGGANHTHRPAAIGMARKARQMAHGSPILNRVRQAASARDIVTARDALTPEPPSEKC